MANDREVIKVVWEGKIPAKFVTEDDRDMQDQGEWWHIWGNFQISQIMILFLFSDPFFLMLPRVSYLPLITDKVKAFEYVILLQKFVLSKSIFLFRSNRWKSISIDLLRRMTMKFGSAIMRFHWNGKIKARKSYYSAEIIFITRHFPIGLLFDLLVTDDNLPWQITVNFKKFPEEILFKCPNK